MGAELDRGDATVEAAAAIMEPVARRLRATSHLYFELEVSSEGRLAASVRHFRPEDVSLSDYESYYYQVDPLTSSFRDWLSEGRALEHGPSVVALGELPHPARTTYERRLLSRAGIADVIGIGIPVSIGARQRVICFGFHRGTCDQSFDRGDRRRLASLSTMLRLQAENLALREMAGIVGTVNRSIGEKSGRDWVLLDHNFEVRDASGESLLFSKCGAVAIETELGEVRHRLAADARAGADGPIAITLAGRHGTDRVFDAEAVHGIGSGRWWLLQVRSHREHERVEAAFREASLSGRERQLVQLLIAGYSSRELSKSLGITINTVENHLRSVYRKFNVSSRAQLTSRFIA